MNVKKKPPLGLMPRRFWLEKRLDDVLEATRRYYAENKSIPSEWVEEINELLHQTEEY